MKKVLAGFFVMAMVLALGGTAQAVEIYNVKIAHMLSETDDTHKGYLALKKMLEERSNGQFKVQIFPSAALGATDDEHAELVNTDAVQIALCGFFSLPNIHKDLAYWAVLDLPFLFQSDAEYYAFLNSNYGRQMAADVLKKTGNILINTAFVRSWHCLTATKASVRVPADMKGLKTLTSSPRIFQSTVRAWGGNVTAIPFAETYTAMQQGGVDANLRAINLHVSQRFYEVQKHFTLVNPFAMSVTSLVSNSFVESLPAELKEIFLTSLADYEKIMQEYGETRQAESVKQLKDYGLECIELGPEEKKLWVEASRPVYDEMEPVIGQDVIARAREIIDSVRRNNP